jgi:peptidoglycan/LPS O-acetylase OafA/YrhL
MNNYSIIRYRSDIDGLRALAVLAVVFHHAFPEYLKGGFVGVDIFFVISGYLISSIILKNLENNNFCLYEFYARRIKRIFPSLLLVLSFCVLLGWFVLTDVEYIQLGKHIKASTLFYTNFTLAKEAGYFDLASIAKPLLHLWSLAVEEQFYIFWPLLLYFGRKYSLNLLSISIVMLLFSFFISINILHKNPVNAFYFPWCRMWELISGSVLAYVSLEKIANIQKFRKAINHYFNIIIYKNQSSHKDTTLQNIASVIGIAMCVLPIVYLKKSNNFPGYQAILPVIGSVLIIAAGNNTWINQKILSQKLFVGIGLISYPLYLWHWPLLSFAHILEGGNLPKKIIWIAILLSFILAWVTYKFFEKPLRLSKDKKVIVLVLSLCFVVMGVFGHFIARNKGYPLRWANLNTYIPGAMREDPRLLENMTLDCLPVSDINKKAAENVWYPIYCSRNSKNPKFFVLGDSHALSFIDFELNENYDFFTLNDPSTLPFINYLLYFNDSFSKYFRRENQLKLHFLKMEVINKILNFYNSIEYVVLVNIGISYSGYNENNPMTIENLKDKNDLSDPDHKYVEGYVELINFLNSQGKKVVFVIDNPAIGFDPKTCLKRPLNFWKKMPVCSLDRSDVDARQKKYRELVAEIQQRVPSLLVYDPNHLFCDEHKCYVKKDGIILYYDQDHLNQEGAKILVNDFVRWVSDLEMKSLK